MPFICQLSRPATSTVRRKGFTARALYVPKVDNTGAGSTDSTTTGLAGVNRAQVTDIGAFYSNGPLNIGLSQQQHKYGATALNALVNPGASSNVANGDYKLTTLAANYKFGDATVYGAVWTEKQATVAASAVVIDASAYMVGAKYSMGAVDFLASYAKRNDKSTVDSATAYANSDRSIYGLGVDYNLSKRTALWVRYENKDPNTNRSGVSGLSATTSLDATKTTAIGVRHTF